MDPPSNHHLLHFTLPRNPSFPSSKNVVASHDHHQQQDLFCFGSLDSPPPQHTRVRSLLPKKPSLISPLVAVGTPTHPPRKTVVSSRLGTRGGRVRGEIIQVQGGHIVRSTGRKDRHSKVCTAMGPRDRRVRLSAPTAIQFYDVQDRLGYDRPSKAVDWLIKKAKAAIDELAHLPSWKPTATAVASPAAATNTATTAQRETMIDFHQTASLDPGEDNGLGSMLRQHRQIDEIDKQNNDPAACSSFLPSSLNSDTIADTIKSFPLGVSSDQSVATSSSLQFHGYSPDLILRTGSQSQDLRLSLQSFQEQPLMLQPRHPQAHKHSHHQKVVLTRTPPHHHNQLVLDGSSASSSATSMWLSDHQRISQWNSSGDDAGTSTARGGGGFMFGSLAAASMPMPTHFSQQGQSFQQRGPLQSSNMASVRAWIDPTRAIATTDHHQVMPGIGFAMGGGYSGYSDILARIRCQWEEMQDGILDMLSSASSDSHSRH